MTASIPKASRAGFKADLEEYYALRLALDVHNYKGDPQGADPIFKRFNIATEKVLGQRAPNIDGVADKLLILWDDEIWLETEKVTPEQIIVGDLRLLARSAK